jgi:excisionase family DNA binding protein
MPTAQMIAGNSDWMTVRQATQYANISRSRLYNLIRDKEVRSVSIKRRGRTRGMRYVSRLSLDRHFDSQCENQCQN